MITASNLRRSGMFLTVELPDGSEVDIRRALGTGWETLIEHLLDSGQMDDTIGDLYNRYDRRAPNDKRVTPETEQQPA